MKTIIFDFDGTLADSFDLIVGIIGKIVMGGRLLGSKEINDLKEHTIIEVTKIMNVSKIKLPFIVAMGRKEMSLNINKIQLHSGIDELVKNLKNEDVKLMVLSSNSKKNIDFVLSKYDLIKYFDKVYGNVGLLSKSRSISKVLKSNKINKNEVIYIGDEARDAIAAKSLEIKFIAVGWGFNSIKLLSKYPNYALVNDTKQLKMKLKDWINHNEKTRSV